jgi:hypothetical protein
MRLATKPWSLLTFSTLPSKVCACRAEEGKPNSLPGFGTDEEAIIWLVLGSQCDLTAAAAEFQKRHRDTLKEKLHKETSGSFQNLLEMFVH